MKKNKEESFECASKLFKEYLSNKKYRKTPERFTILKEIYLNNGHFDIKSLYHHMKMNKYRVSRATLYNTIQLLLDAQLITKYQFGKNVAHFEKIFKLRQHEHLICADCSKIFDFCNPLLHKIIKDVEKDFDFEITNHSLILHGKCNKLKFGHCEHKKKNDKTS